jgi:hypothetical protein
VAKIHQWTDETPLGFINDELDEIAQHIVRNLTTTERNALTPSAGEIIFNTTTSKGQMYDGSAWNDLW